MSLATTAMSRPGSRSPSATDSSSAGKNHHQDAPKAGKSQPGLRLRMRVVSGDDIAVGPGKIELLLAVQQHQSISAAAKALGMSYRRAWLLIDEMNRSLKEPVVTTETGGSHGGGTMLTKFGLRLIELYQGIEAQALQTCSADIRKLLAMVAR